MLPDQIFGTIIFICVAVCGWVALLLQQLADKARDGAFVEELFPSEGPVLRTIKAIQIQNGSGRRAFQGYFFARDVQRRAHSTIVWPVLYALAATIVYLLPQDLAIPCATAIKTYLPAAILLSGISIAAYCTTVYVRARKQFLAIQ